MNDLKLEVEDYNEDSEIFEGEDKIKEFETINYIKNNNGKTKIRAKLDNNINENLYIFKEIELVLLY